MINKIRITIKWIIIGTKPISSGMKFANYKLAKKTGNKKRIEYNSWTNRKLYFLLKTVAIAEIRINPNLPGCGETPPTSSEPPLS